MLFRIVGPDFPWYWPHASEAEAMAWMEFEQRAIEEQYERDRLQDEYERQCEPPDDDE